MILLKFMCLRIIENGNTRYFLAPLYYSDVLITIGNVLLNPS